MLDFSSCPCVGFLIPLLMIPVLLLPLGFPLSLPFPLPVPLSAVSLMFPDFYRSRTSREVSVVAALRSVAAVLIWRYSPKSVSKFSLPTALLDV